MLSATLCTVVVLGGCNFAADICGRAGQHQGPNHLKPNVLHLQAHLEAHVKQVKTQNNEIVWFRSWTHVAA